MFEEIDLREMEYRIEVIEHRLRIDRKGLPAHDSWTPNLQSRLESIEEKLGIYRNYGEDLEDVLEPLDDRSLQQIFREIDAKDFAIALVGMKKEILLRIKNNFSKKAWSMMCDEVVYEMRDGLTNSAIKMARAKFMNTILILESMGEIVVPRDEEEQNENSLPTRSFIREFLQDVAECEKSKQTLRLWKTQVFDTLEQDVKAS